MSKYPVQYVSGSKKVALNIEDMNTSHLCNAWRKMQVGTPSVHTCQLVDSMCAELHSRGGTYDGETDQWTFPPKPEVATP